MARTHKKVRYSPDRKDRGHTPSSAAEGVEAALKILEGRWKLVILFHLFDGKLLRFSELERAIPSISQKMLIQQLRQLENDGVVRRIVHQQVRQKPGGPGETRLALTFSLNRVDRADRTTPRSNASVTDKIVASWRLFPRQ
jgi:DNA-binding HxlR family transcriptional regulator